MNEETRQVVKVKRRKMMVIYQLTGYLLCFGAFVC